MCKPLSFIGDKYYVHKQQAVPAKEKKKHKEDWDRCMQSGAGHTICK